MEKQVLSELSPFLDDKGNLKRSRVRITKDTTAFSQGDTPVHLRKGTVGTITHISSADGRVVVTVLFHKAGKDCTAILEPSSFIDTDQEPEKPTSSEEEMQVDSVVKTYNISMDQTELDVVLGAVRVVSALKPEDIQKLMAIGSVETARVFQQVLSEVRDCLSPYTAIEAEPVTDKGEDDDLDPSDLVPDDED